MTKFLKVSMFLNVVLAGGAIFIWMDRQKPALSPAPMVQPATRPAEADRSASAIQMTTQAKPAPFRWNQLDASDYHVYVKNLRAIGCPEATVRAIVTADVHAAYQMQINALEKKLKAFASGSWSAEAGALNDEAKLKEQLQNLPGEEAAEIADLLGLKPDALSVAANDSSSSSSTDDEPTQDPIPASVPLVFQNLDTSSLALDDQQTQAIASLRQRFVDQVGGTNQDPNDPAYLARWQQAQPAADSMLRSVLGNQSYSQYQLMQLRQALAQSQGTPMQ
jgi:hypothetical protein